MLDQSIKNNIQFFTRKNNSRNSIKFTSVIYQKYFIIHPNLLSQEVETQNCYSGEEFLIKYNCLFDLLEGT